ncbi:MAG: PAS domain-containing protein [Hymenobacter sp.]
MRLLREPNHRIEYCNPAFQRLFPGRELLGHTLAEVAPELAATGFVTRLDHVYGQGHTGVDYAVPFAVQAPGEAAPHPTYFTFTYQAYQEGGRTAGASVFAYDVTEQVRARLAREQQQQELEQLFMQAPAPIVILDGPALVFQLVNPAYQQIFPGRELVGKPLLDALPELTNTPIPGLFRHVFATGEPYVAHEMPLLMARHEGGPLEEIYWTFSYQARRDERGAVDGVRVFAHEVTAPVRARQLALANVQQAQAQAQELTTANRQLSRANADLDAFAYTASHDLQGPVDNLDGLLRALLEQLPPAALADAEVQPLLALMQGAITRFGRTLDQLTAVIREQAAQDQPPNRWTWPPSSRMCASTYPLAGRHRAPLAGGRSRLPAPLVCSAQPAQRLLQPAQQRPQVPRPRPPAGGARALPHPRGKLRAGSNR